jgi:hypothetical protein
MKSISQFSQHSTQKRLSSDVTDEADQKWQADVILVQARKNGRASLLRCILLGFPFTPTLLPGLYTPKGRGTFEKSFLDREETKPSPGMKKEDLVPFGKCLFVQLI